jgi:hypothetical protein
MREDTTESAQPLASAWTIQTDRIRVPAPRLELGTGSDPVGTLKSIIAVALEELTRGQTKHSKAILNTLKEVLK